MITYSRKEVAKFPDTLNKDSYKTKLETYPMNFLILSSIWKDKIFVDGSMLKIDC